MNDMKSMKNITLNGEKHTTDKRTLLELLSELGMTEGRFAVEVDDTLLPKSRLGEAVIIDGMNVEVVQAVGGG